MRKAKSLGPSCSSMYFILSIDMSAESEHLDQIAAELAIGTVHKRGLDKLVRFFDCYAVRMLVISLSSMRTA